MMRTVVDIFCSRHPATARVMVTFAAGTMCYVAGGVFIALGLWHFGLTLTVFGPGVVMLGVIFLGARIEANYRYQDPTLTPRSLLDEVHALLGEDGDT